MKTFHKLVVSVKNKLQPLPNAKEYADKYILLTKMSTIFMKKRSFLSNDQITWIAEAVLEEAKTSRGFGLFIRPEDLNNEMIVWIVFVNRYFDPKSRLIGKSFEQVSKIITEILNIEFDEASRYYFEKIKNSKPKIVNANTAFRVHMEAVRCRILTQIFSEKPPFNKTEEAK